MSAQAAAQLKAFDLLVVGGGMVGASLAIALSGQGLKLGIIEAHPPRIEQQPSYDDRAIALSYGGRRIFAGMGVWESLSHQAEAIHRIHVSDRGGFGFSHLSAVDEGVPALGYVVSARQLGQVLLDRLAECEDVTLISPAEVVEIESNADQVRVEVQRNGVQDALCARLLVGADGANSSVRKHFQLPVTQWEYAQAAVVANLTPQQPHGGTAYERFTESGPLALLPMSEGRCALVYTVERAQLEAVLQMDDADFLAAVQGRFGWRLGRFTQLGKRSSYPLSLLRARRSTAPRTVIIGNAAHTLHPIAGQGFNLGLRDVAALVDPVLQAHRVGLDVGDQQVLSAYAAWRHTDQYGVTLATDALARIFGNPLGPVRAGRNLGLLAVDALPGARHLLARGAMGLLGKLPRMARGLPPR